jgi:hypothetical protein
MTSNANFYSHFLLRIEYNFLVIMCEKSHTTTAKPFSPKQIGVD